MVPSRVAGGTAQSSSSSGIFFQEDRQSQVAGNSQFSSNFGNSLSSLPGNAQGNLGPVSGDVSNRVLNSMGSSGPSVGASSLVTDANSGLSGGPHLQRSASASINTESYMRLPASPMSFSSNNISISGSSVMDGSSVVQQSSNQDSGSQHGHQSQQHQGASSATSLLRMGQVQYPGGARVPSSFIQEPSTISQLQKKPCLDLKQEDIVQKLLQRQDSMHLQNSNPQLQALYQQQRLRQQEQQLLQAMPPMQRIQLLQQQQQLQLRQQLQVQGMQPAAAVKQPCGGGICSHRLMQYLYHQRQRPVDAWQCDICGSKSGRGFEASFEVLPRLNEIKFGSGVIDELLFLDLPRECRFTSGIMMLEYAKAVQESVYEQLRVVREGQLRIFFTPDLKILSWEFCARCHEELLPRRLVAPQVNQLLQAAQKCQSTISKSGADGISQQDLLENCVMVVTAGRQLASGLELQSLNDLGFSKRYVRCLQIADVVNSMKDLMDFCRDLKKGPIEGLKSFPRCCNMPKAPMQKMQEMEQAGGTLNKLMLLRPGLNSQMMNHQNVIDGGPVSVSAQAALALSNCQNLLTRQNSMNSTNNPTQQEGSSPFSTSTPGSSGTLPGMVQNSSISGFSGCQVPQQLPKGNVSMQQSQSFPSQGNETLQQQMIQRFLLDMSRKNNGETVSMQNPGGAISGSGPGFRNSPETAAASNGPVVSVKAESHMGLDQKAQDLTHSHTLDEMAPDFSHEFIEDGFFNNDLDVSMNFSWKA